MIFRQVSTVLLMVAIAGCGGGSPPISAKLGEGQAHIAQTVYGSSDGPVAPSAEAGRMNYGEASTPSADAIRRSATQRLVITTGTIKIEVDDFASVASGLRQKAQGLGGFVTASQENVDPRGKKYGSVTFRIPSVKLDEFLAAARALGKVLGEESKADDVTEQYYDIDARLKAQKKLETELLELMSTRRGSLEDLLNIEREIARVRGEIESMEGRLRYLADQSAMSTIMVDIKEPAALVSIEPRPYEPITNALGKSVTVFSMSVATIVIAISALGPWIIGLLLFIWISRRVGVRWTAKVSDVFSAPKKKEDI